MSSYEERIALEDEAYSRVRNQFVDVNGVRHDIPTKIFASRRGDAFYWFEVSESEFSNWKLPAPSGVDMHGPFSSEQEAKTDQGRYFVERENGKLGFPISSVRRC
jgi:hypothetical protein